MLADSAGPGPLPHAPLPAAADARVLDAAVLARVRPGRVAILRDRPGGRVVLRVGDRTRFGSRSVLWVQRRRGGWGAVRHERAGNRRLLWVRLASPAVALDATRWSIAVDRSDGRLEVRHDGRVVRRVAVGVGRPDSPTPTGRFHVSDELPGPAFSRAYGCCILALSAVQEDLPAGWRGGNRMAIHGGSGASAGCVRAADRDVQAIARLVPLGTPVVIRA